MGVRMLVTCDRCTTNTAKADHDSPTTDEAVRAVNRVLESERWRLEQGAIVCAACSAKPLVRVPT